MQVYRLISQRTRSRLAARITTGFTLVSIAGLAQGGTAPTLIALPFALWALQFLDRYLRQDARDEAFIFFGMSGAFVFVISPIMTILWLLSCLALLVFNIQNKRIGRGIYQLLAILFGLVVTWLGFVPYFMSISDIPAGVAIGEVATSIWLYCCFLLLKCSSTVYIHRTIHYHSAYDIRLYR